MKQFAALLCLTAIFLAAGPVSAQTSRFNVTGVVADTSGSGMSQATIVALTRADSVLSKFATSGPDGQFTLRRMTPGEYILQITYVGFNTLRQDFEIVSEDVDVGTVTIHELTEELDELVVSADHIPFVVKRDTLEYNANAFSTRPSDNVEDLLRRLPGIDVEPDGTIRAQGEEVQNVLVDGREFFADTPTVATKNLPADAVDKVQVYDKESDQAEFTGIPDGEEEKTIDLLLKEDAKRGVLGNIEGSLGGEQSPVGRYQAKVNLHRFSPSLQSSLIGNAANTGQSGFGTADIVNMIQTGGGMMMLSEGMGLGNFRFGGGLSGGFSESIDAGLNLSRNFSKRTWLRGSYYLSSLDQLQDSQSQRHELAGQGDAVRWSQDELSNSNSIGHSVNVNGQLQISEGHELRLRSTFRFNWSGSDASNVQNAYGAQDILRNAAATQYDTNGYSGSGSGILTWRKTLGDRGRTLVARGELSLTDNDQTADLLTRSALANSGNVMSWREQQQEQEQFGRSSTLEQRLSLTEPLSSAVSLEFFGEHILTRREEDKQFFNIDGESRILDSRTSNAFERTYRYYRGGGQITWENNDNWLLIGTNVQRSSLQGLIETGGNQVDAGYTHLLPRIFYKLSIGNGRDLQIRYRTSTREPSLRELQPYEDNNDPLRIYVGNPELTPESAHRLSVNYNSFDQWTGISFFIFTESGYTRNSIVPTRTIDENFRQVVSAVNAGPGWSSNANMNFRTPIRPLGIAVSLNNDFSLELGRGDYQWP